MRRLIAVALAGACGTAVAFSLDGFSTGQDLADVQRATIARGYTMRLAFRKDRAESYMTSYGQTPPTQFGPSFGFCEGKLISYDRRLDFDADYAIELDKLLTDFGQPRKTYVKRDQWGNGYVVGVAMNFYKGDERAILLFNPEGRAGNGELRYMRSAHIALSSKNTCWTDW